MQTVAINETKERLYEIIENIARQREPVAIASEGETLAVLLDPRDYERMVRVYDEALARAWETVEQIRARNTDLDPDEIYRIVTEVVEEVRQERYDRRQSEATDRP
jgi:PHD/YefM family antitoxin component YafN of YafNO toxin-antitoxin module